MARQNRQLKAGEARQGPPERIRIPVLAMRSVHRAADRAGIREVCFAAFGAGGDIATMVRIPNRASDPFLHHRIWDKDVRKARRALRDRGLECVALLHTHIVSRPFPGDGDICGYAPGSIVLIYSSLYRECRAFHVSPRRVRQVPVLLTSQRREILSAPTCAGSPELMIKLVPPRWRSLRRPIDGKSFVWVPAT